MHPRAGGPVGSGQNKVCVPFKEAVTNPPSPLMLREDVASPGQVFGFCFGD